MVCLIDSSSISYMITQTSIDTAVMLLHATLNEARNIKAQTTQPSYHVTYHLPPTESLQGSSNISPRSSIKHSNQPVNQSDFLLKSGLKDFKYWAEQSFHVINARGLLAGIEVRLWESSSGKEKLIGSCILDQITWNGEEHWARLESHGKPRGELSIQLEKIPLLAPTDECKSGQYPFDIIFEKHVFSYIGSREVTDHFRKGVG
jgi:hypothetical protein